MNQSIELLNDGIQLESGPLPGWWKSILITTLALCPVYWLYFHSGAPGRTMADAYDQAVFNNAQLLFAQIGELNPDADTIRRFSAKDNWVKVGKAIFKSNCIACHGRSGEGIIGPNLTDDSYKSVRSIEDIARVILKGANNNAMPAWEGKLQTNEVVLVSAYVASLRGTNVAGGKSPEGAEIPPWPPVPPEPEVSQ
ncbi:MAG: c-type cytochrome [Planctomycetales bacterium]|nr:c-type cytochrome [Planctomycetales bacterium]